MTTVGHSLTGMAIAALTLPQAQSRRWYIFIVAGFVFFANLPDYPLPGWGHNSYLVSHSIFVTVLLASLMALLLLWPTFQAGVGKRVLIAWSVAWFSHMLLDSMYNHGQGIAIFWPFSEAHLAMPVSLFETIRLPARSEHNLRVFGIEAIVFGIALIVCVGLRRLFRKDRVRPH